MKLGAVDKQVSLERMARALCSAVVEAADQ